MYDFHPYVLYESGVLWDGQHLNDVKFLLFALGILHLVSVICTIYIYTCTYVKVEFFWSVWRTSRRVLPFLIVAEPLNIWPDSTTSIFTWIFPALGSVGTIPKKEKQNWMVRIKEPFHFVFFFHAPLVNVKLCNPDTPLKEPELSTNYRIQCTVDFQISLII